MVSTPTPPVTIPAKTHIAQLVPFKFCVSKPDSEMQGNRGFGSTGEPQIYWTQVVSDGRPNMVCTLTMPQQTHPKLKLVE